MGMGRRREREMVGNALGLKGDRMSDGKNFKGFSAQRIKIHVEIACLWVPNLLMVLVIGHPRGCVSPLVPSPLLRILPLLRPGVVL